MQGPSIWGTVVTIPYGATTGQRIVIDGVRGAILEYDASNNLIGSDSPVDGTDAYGHAYIHGRTQYVSPGVGIAASLSDGGVSLWSGPTSGLGPWVNQGNIITTASGIQIATTQATERIAIISSQAAGAPGVTIDGYPYGGQFARILEANSPESYANTTLTTSPNLQVTGLTPSGLYMFHMRAIYDGAAANGGLIWKVVFNNTGQTGHAGQIYEGTTGAQVTNGDTFSTGLSGHSAGTVGAGSFLTLDIEGEVALGASTSTCSMQFAQNVTASPATKIYSGSFLSLERTG